MALLLIQRYQDVPIIEKSISAYLTSYQPSFHFEPSFSILKIGALPVEEGGRWPVPNADI
jgi:hypothetical protein